MQSESLYRTMDDKTYVERYNKLYRESAVDYSFFSLMMKHSNVRDQEDIRLLLQYFNYLRNVLSMAFAHGKSAKNVYEVLDRDGFQPFEVHSISHFADKQKQVHCSKYKIQLMFVTITEIAVDLMPYTGKWKEKILKTIIEKLINAEIYN